jgi:cytochrome c553
LGAAALVSAAFGAAPALAQTDLDAQIEAGRRIYVDAVLPDGRPLSAQRLGARISGASIACVACHRGSGMGSVEATYQSPPITGRALFSSDEKVVASMDMRSGKALNQRHAPYTDETLARAMRDGTNVSGRPMLDIMPRFELDDTSMAALAAYLHTLSVDPSPGITDKAIKFATIIAPGVAPARQDAFLKTLKAAVAQKNGNTMPGKRHMVTAIEFALKTERRWELAVWQLEGEPETWAAQLDARYRAEPVFAVLSGLSTGAWQPVHEFCEGRRVPCWFPSVAAVPAQAGSGRYALYYQRGVTLEAEVLAHHFGEQAIAARPRRVVQIGLSSDPAATQGMKALTAALGTLHIDTIPQVLPGAEANAADLRKALAGLGARDAVMVWLPGASLQALQEVAVPSAAVYFSALTAGAEYAPLPPAWRSAARLVYPYEMPEIRGANLAYFRTWINQRRIPLVDEPLQSEVFFAVNYLSETIGEMLGNFYRDYLVERAESMLSLRELRHAEEETRLRQQIRQREKNLIRAGHTGGNPADAASQPQRAVITPEENLGARTGNSVYPNLSLGPGQRFASRGGYIVHFGAGGRQLVADSDWLVPDSSNQGAKAQTATH